MPQVKIIPETMLERLTNLSSTSDTDAWSQSQRVLAQEILAALQTCIVNDTEDTDWHCAYCASPYCDGTCEDDEEYCSECGGFGCYGDCMRCDYCGSISCEGECLECDYCGSVMCDGSCEDDDFDDDF